MRKGKIGALRELAMDLLAIKGLRDLRLSVELCCQKDLTVPYCE